MILSDVTFMAMSYHHTLRVLSFLSQCRVLLSTPAKKAANHFIARRVGQQTEFKWLVAASGRQGLWVQLCLT